MERHRSETLLERTRPRRFSRYAGARAGTLAQASAQYRWRRRCTPGAPLAGSIGRMDQGDRRGCVPDSTPAVAEAVSAGHDTPLVERRQLPAALTALARRLTS